jgi:hypothetical protein
MEKDGWLDQLLLGILRFLTDPWLGMGVALVGGAAVAYLARVSPGPDWEFIKEWPGKALLGAFLLYSSLRSTPRLVMPEIEFLCDEGTGPFGSTVTTNCRTELHGEVATVQDYTLLDTARDFALSFAQETAVGLVGAGLGLLVARSVLRARSR